MGGRLEVPKDSTCSIMTEKKLAVAISVQPIQKADSCEGLRQVPYYRGKEMGLTATTNEGYNTNYGQK